MSALYRQKEDSNRETASAKPARRGGSPLLFGAALLVFIIALLGGLLLFPSLEPLLSQEGRYAGKIVSDVEFEGIYNAPVQELYELLVTRIGEPLQRRAFNEDVKALFDSGYFSNVAMRVRLLADNSVVVVYELQERPVIDEIKLIGLEELVVDDIRAQLKPKQGEPLLLWKVREGLATIKRLYIEGGFPFAEVWYRIGPLDPENNTVEVYYIIDEGSNIPVGDINILGTRNLDPDDILDILENKESTALEDGIFQESSYEEDQFKILAYAKSKGYLSAEIDAQSSGYEIRWRNPQDREEGRVVIITYTIIEGEQKFFGGYSLEHDPKGYNQELNPPERGPQTEIEPTPIFSPEALLSILNYQDSSIGEIFNEQQYFMDRAAMQEQYAGRGYVFAQVGPDFVDFQLNEETLDRYERCAALSRPAQKGEARCRQEASWLNLDQLREQLAEDPALNDLPMRHVHFTIRENNLAYIENIIIKGNQKTKEHVIRREILIKEGQLFNFFLVNESRRRIVNLGYFKEVNLQTLPSPTPGRMNLIFEVEEQPTGTISLGGGYGTNSGFSIFAQVGESNLGGNGHNLTARVEYGPLSRSLRLSWTDPWFYERCQSSSGSFWRNRLKSFEAAQDLLEIEALAAEFENEYRQLGAEIEGYVQRATGRIGRDKEPGNEPDSEIDKEIEILDGVKAKIRELLTERALEEYRCYTDIPRPWSLSLGFFLSSFRFEQAPSINEDLVSGTDDAEYRRDSYGFTIGTSHPLTYRWSHYHSYRPSFQTTSDVSSLASDEAFRREQLGVQFKSSLLNGLAYSSLDRGTVPTEGLKSNFEFELVGNLLGGEDHFNRYTISSRYYLWWLDFTFGGSVKNRNLRRWRIVQEFSFRSTFSHETYPYYSDQNRERNPFLDSDDLLYLGGTGSSQFGRLRGYQANDTQNYPVEWANGGNHLLTYGTELRVPFEPSLVWFVLFFDAGSLYDNLGSYTGVSEERLESYQDGSIEAVFSGNERGSRFTDPEEWNDPRRISFARRNIALDRFLYAWGYGFRIEIPVLPLRIYFAQKLYYSGKGDFRTIPGDDNFDLVLGIGDVRF